MESHSKSIEYTTHSETETIELGRKIGAALIGGEVLGLIGNLGTGKTHLIKGIVLGLEAQRTDMVSSPTFVLVHEYFGRGGRVHIYHIDAYRIESQAEFEALGFEEYCRPDSVVLVEWADKVMGALKGIEAIRIELFHAGQNDRRIVVRGLAV